MIDNVCYLLFAPPRVVTLYEPEVWARAIPGNIVLFTASGYGINETYAGTFSTIHEFDNYEITQATEKVAIDIHTKTPIQAIVAVSEMDVLRASQLREMLGVPGMRHHDALAFRDKVLMKSLARVHGLKVPQFCEVNNSTDVLSFVSHHGLPVVLKPRDGKGSLGVRVLSSSADVEQVAYEVENSEKGGWQIESFVTGNMYRVDGVVLNGKIDTIHIGSYTDSTLSFLEGKPISTLEVHCDSSVRKRISDYTITLIRDALPMPQNSLFHLQVFEDMTGDIVLCEIGCRLGGGAICDEVFYSTGVNILFRYLAAEFNHTESFPTQEAEALLCGRMIVPAKGGYLQFLASECPVPGVRRYRTNGREGMLYPPSAMTNAEIQSIIFTSDTVDGLKQVNQKLEEWVAQSTCWIDRQSEQDDKVFA